MGGAMLEVSVTYKTVLLESGVQQLSPGKGFIPHPSLDHQFRLSVSVVRLTGLKVCTKPALRPSSPHTPPPQWL